MSTENPAENLNQVSILFSILADADSLCCVRIF